MASKTSEGIAEARLGNEAGTRDAPGAAPHSPRTYQAKGIQSETEIHGFPFQASAPAKLKRDPAAYAR